MKNFTIIFLLALVLMISVSNVSFADVHSSVTNAKNILQNIPLSSFKNENLKDAYLNDLEAVDRIINVAEGEIDAGNKTLFYQDALDTVNNLISKTDGCALRGMGDAEDWVTVCTDSSAVYTGLNQLASDLSGLIQ